LVGDVQIKREIVRIIHHQMRSAVTGAEIVVASTMRLIRSPERNSRKRQGGQEQKPHIDKKRPV
jgi:hypothetical protein